MEFLEQLLDVELGLPARFIIAFVTVLVLIGLTAWIVRRIAAGRGGVGGGRARQQRLSVVDAAQIDAKRRLLLVRRDNTEHLILIGGPTDVVVESQIGRGTPAGEHREARIATHPGGPPQRPQPPREEPPIPPRPSRPAPPAQPAPVPQPAPAPQPAPPLQSVPARAPQPAEVPPRAERAPPPEPRIGHPSAAPQPQAPHVPQAGASNPQPNQPAQSADPKLQDMAQRLESALTRPYEPPPPRAGEAEEPRREPGSPEVGLYDEDKKRDS